MVIRAGSRAARAPSSRSSLPRPQGGDHLREREAPVAEWQPLPPGPEQLQRPGYYSRVATQARYIFNDLDDMVAFLGEI